MPLNFSAAFPALPAATRRSGRRPAGGPFPPRLFRYCAMLLLLVPPLLPAAAWGQEVLVFRTVFQGQQQRPTGQLAPEVEVELRNEFWRVAAASRLRVESSDPDALVTMRFRAASERSGALVLTVTLVSRRGLFTYRYEEGSQVMTEGAIGPREEFRVGAGMTTDLQGTSGNVTEIRIQDDATAELRLSLKGGELLLRAIPAAEGGELSGRAYPIFRGEKLEFLDATVLGAGWTDNGYGELRFDHFAFKLNGFVDGDKSAAAGRLVVRQQLWRGRTLGVWLEGGGGFFTQEPSDPSEEKEGLATPVFGATGLYRFGNWSASLHVASLNGPVLTMAMAGWQFSRSFGAILQWQSLLGFSGFGAGIGIGF